MKFKEELKIALLEMMRKLDCYTESASAIAFMRIFIASQKPKIQIGISAFLRKNQKWIEQHSNVEIVERIKKEF